jgi:hypothetical protein
MKDLVAICFCQDLDNIKFISIRQCYLLSRRGVGRGAARRLMQLRRPPPRRRPATRAPKVSVGIWAGRSRGVEMVRKQADLREGGHAAARVEDEEEEAITPPSAASPPCTPP